MKMVSSALTPMQDQQLGEIDSHIQSLFHEKAEQWARVTGFVQRASKISGSAFAQTLVFGFLNQPEASYTDLQQTMQLQGVDAIEERMTPQAAALMNRLLEEMVAMVISGQECHIPVLESFNGVYRRMGGRRGTSFLWPFFDPLPPNPSCTFQCNGLSSIILYVNGLRLSSHRPSICDILVAGDA